MTTEASDNLRSIARAKFLDVLCEGEIGGLVNGARSIYLDDTPLQNPDGSFNFGTSDQPVIFDFRSGTLDQAAIGGFPAIENTSTVNVRIQAATPVVRQFADPALTAVKVVIGVPTLSKTDTASGDIGSTTVVIAIDVQSNGGPWTIVLTNQIYGKSSTRYQRTYRIPLPPGGAPWGIRVRRLTEDSTSQFVQNETWLDLLTEVIDSKVRMPWRANLGISFDAKQFTNIPRRAYDLRLKLVKVPSNYDPFLKTYSGAWDGLFSPTLQWTDNPAWCFYDLVTHPRYGLGGFIDVSQIDKWSLYTIAQYCDQLVPDGFGGMEPRFTCNLFLSERAEAYKVLNDFASIFRAMLFWGSGSVTAVQDSPSSPVALFSPANVIDGTFSYAGSSAKQRHTVALVTWNDPADLFRPKVEYVDDEAGIVRFGIVETQVVAMGCTSRGQANRVGRWLLFTERLQTEVITFKTGLEGAVARPGNVIKIADPVRAGKRMGGRLLAATAASVTLDAPVDLNGGTVYTLSTLKSDGTVQTATVSTTAGTGRTVLTLSPAFAQAPAVGGIWVLTAPTLDAQLFRILSVTEDKDTTYLVSAIAYNPGKFDAIELGLTLQPRDISDFAFVPLAPASLSLAEVLYLQTGVIRSRLDVSWPASAYASGYLLRYSRDGVVCPDIRVTGTNAEIDNVQQSTYTVTVYAIGAFGDQSPAGTTRSIVVQGKAAPPSNVSGLVSSRYGTTLNLLWNPVPDADFDHYEVRRGGSWLTGIVSGMPRDAKLEVLSPRGGRYMVKAVDTSGNPSALEAVVDIPDSSDVNVVVVSDDGAAGFAGTLTDCARIWDPIAGQYEVTIVAPGSWASMTLPWCGYVGPWVFESGAVTANYATWAAMSSPWSIYSAPTWESVDEAFAGTYVSSVIDVGFVASSVVTIDATVGLLSATAQPWRTYVEPWATYTSPDWTWQGLITGVSSQFDVATSNDNVTWSDWFRPGVGAVSFRYIKVRVRLATTDSDYRPVLSELVINIDVPDRVEHFEDVAVPLAGATIAFAPMFVGVQTVQVTLQSAAYGDRFTVTAKSNSSVTIKVFDSTGAAITGLVDVDVFGYGSRT